VFFQLHCDEIMVHVTDMSGKESGKPGFLSAWQDSTTVLLDKLPLRIRENMLKLLQNGQHRPCLPTSNPGVFIHTLPCCSK
jgi:hypothetical protein